MNSGGPLVRLLGRTGTARSRRAGARRSRVIGRPYSTAGTGAASQRT